jgi:hypothetical protein
MNDPAIKRGWLRVTIYLFSMIAVMAFLSVPAMFAIRGLTDIEFIDLQIDQTDSVYIMSLFYTIVGAGITGLTILFIKVIDGRKTKHLGFFKYRYREDLLLGLITGFVILGAGFGILTLSGYISISGKL